MSYYDEDFYTEPCEFEEQIEELKAALASSVQQKFLDEMDALRKENKSLREFRDKKEAYERELAQVKQQYKTKMRDAEMNADRKKLKDLLSGVSTIGYRVGYKYIQGPKCDKCENDRKIHFTSPSGRKMKEDCLCARRTVNYYPTEVSLVSFYARDEVSSVYYEMKQEDRDCDRYDLCAEIYDHDKAKAFEEINKYRVVFLEKEDCQRYCDWLNEVEAQKGSAPC
ncbi:MAG: DUF3987 domain-containing protein [Oscillospiraceae bacterium]|nr:DUF3987 domain-containing protein [Oscillospiraceae bacterium]